MACSCIWFSSQGFMVPELTFAHKRQTFIKVLGRSVIVLESIILISPKLFPLYSGGKTGLTGT